MAANISASLVKDLREKTGAGMMECKKALTESNGDLEGAVKILRESGAAKAAKREARTAAEGLVDIAISTDSKSGAIAELNSETDFVARNEEFQKVSKALAATALKGKTTSAGALGPLTLEGHDKACSEVVVDLLAKIGEKITLSRADFLEGDLVVGYIHPPGKIGVLISVKLDGANGSDELVETLRGIAMHIAATGPRFLDGSQVDKVTLDAEADIYANIARKEGKPENIIPRIVDGKIKSFYKDNCLVDQLYVKGDKETVGAVLEKAAKAAGGKASITRFVRYKVGETAVAAAGEE